MADDITVSRDLLHDAFGRVRDQVPSVLDGLSQEDLAHRPGGTGNSIAWLVWHLSRIEDDHIAGLAGIEQVWTAGGFHARSGLPYGPEEHGYGHTSEQVDAAGHLEVDFLVEYHEAVHAQTEVYLATVDADELAKVIDTRWDPPVTVAIRLVSVIGDALAHLGQAAYIRGLLGKDSSE